jgi:uncharacterized protein YkwD
MLRILVCLAVLPLAGCVVKAGDSALGALLDSPDGGGGVRQINAVEDMSFAEILNTYRASIGGNPVTFDSRLNQAAQDYADVLAANPGYLGSAADPHIGPDGSTTLSRIQATGYVPTAYAENLAGNQGNEQTALQAWIDSPSHDRNLRGGPLEEFGLGLAEASGGRTRWVLVLGTE